MELIITIPLFIPYISVYITLSLNLSVGIQMQKLSPVMEIATHCHNLSKATHCVVEYWAWIDGPMPKLMMIADTPLRDVLMMTRPQRHVEWNRLVGPNTPVMIRILAIGTKVECMAMASQEASKANPLPHCTLHGSSTNVRYKAPISCSNGKTYQTQQQAADDTGADQGSISKCLRGAMRHTAGLSFWYVSG